MTGVAGFNQVKDSSRECSKAVKASELFGLYQEFADNPKLVVLTGTSPQKLCEANASRIALIIAAPDNSALVFLTTNPNAAPTEGIPVSQAGKSSFEVYYGQSGALCQKAWYVAGNTMAGNMFVLEVLFRS